SATYGLDWSVPGQGPINANIGAPYNDFHGFQPGSAFRVFTLLDWLENGHALDDVVDGTAREFQMSQFTSCDGALSGKSFTMKNTPAWAGSMTVADATRNSVSVAFMEMATQLSLCDIMTRAADLGVVEAQPKDREGKPIDGPVAFNDHYPVNVIGTTNTTPLAMAGAFAAFASRGIYCTPTAMTRIVDRDGTVWTANNGRLPDPGCHQEIDPAVANTMAYAMSGVWEGTMKGVGDPGFPAAGITGESNNNEYSWFVGFTPRLSAAVVTSGSLLGYKTANNRTIGGARYAVVYGATISGPTWKRFAVEALAHGNNPPFAP
ncbi:MAG: penicillin-binding transpeptidase domain-containing protein, partial [Micrococcales bacterium]|nr:penicillin-binding transpeptidase domain-containing protein [Micrococcales bacterium]